MQSIAVLGFLQIQLFGPGSSRIFKAEFARSAVNLLN